jgi:hypothetical protein
MGFSWVTMAQTNVTTQAANTVVRRISLQETIQLALQYNLALQIERLAPELSRFNLAGSYSYYDPTFTLRGEQNFISSPGGFNSTLGLPTPASDTWTEHFNAGLVGRAPTGLKYDMGADLRRTSGSFPVANTNGTFTFVDRPFQYRPDVGINLTQPLLKDFWTDADRTAIKVNKEPRSDR